CARKIAKDPISISALRDPRFSQIWLKRHRFVGSFLHRRSRIRVCVNAIEEKKTSNDAEARPCEGEFWIELHGSRVFGGGLLVGGVTITLMFDRQRAQVSVVRSKILSWLVGDRLLFCTGQLRI